MFGAILVFDPELDNKLLEPIKHAVGQPQALRRVLEPIIERQEKCKSTEVVKRV